MKRDWTARRTRAWAVLDTLHAGDDLSRRVHAFILGLIILNVLAVIAASVQSISLQWDAWFDVFEVISVAVFSVEYVLRVWSCTADPRFAHPVWGRLRFMLTPMALVDLVAVLPSYLSFMHMDLRFVRALRLVRLTRVAKLGRYSEASAMLIRVLRSRREELLLATSLLFTLTIVCASLMYVAERDAQPAKFQDIPHALWWAVITITTVGYGDDYPITAIGRVVGALTAILGVLMIALPTGVFGAAFVEEIQRRKQNGGRPTCPHCGNRL